MHLVACRAVLAVIDAPPLQIDKMMMHTQTPSGYSWFAHQLDSKDCMLR